MSVGLICAIPPELRQLLDDLDADQLVPVAGIDFVCGRLDGIDVVLVGSGIGKVNAALVATLLLDRFGCTSVVFTGVAGGLDPALRIGDIVVADRMVHCDAGVIENGQLSAYQAGHLPFVNPTDELGYPMDPELLGRLRTELTGLALSGDPAVVFGPVLTGDQYLHCETTRRRLHHDHRARAIEMEGAAMVQVCERFGAPWLVIRALSDLAGADSSTDFNEFVEYAAVASAAVVRRLLPVMAGR